MNDNDNIYTIFQTLQSDNLSTIYSSILGPSDPQKPENKAILTFSQTKFSFLRRALPPMAFQHKGIHQTIFYENLTPLNSQGKIITLCFDDPTEVECALSKLSQLPNFEKHLIMIPRLTTVCQTRIDQSGLKIHVIEYPLEIVPLEDYCFVVPSPLSFVRCFVNNDINDVYTIANSLLKIHLFTGCPQKVLACGQISCRVSELLNQFKQQIGKSFFKKEPEFDKIVIIDRTADLLTPLMTQFYYGGMLDEAYDVDYGYLKLPNEIVLEDTPEQREVLLNVKTDEFFERLRGEAFSDALDQALSAREEMIGLKESMEKASGTVQYGFYARRAKHLAETRQYLFMHYNLLEELVNKMKPMRDMNNFEYNCLMQDIDDISIVDRLLNREQYWHAIRLFCFASVCMKGLSKTMIFDFQKRLTARFGFDVMQDLINLDRSGLLNQSKSLISQFSSAMKGETQAKFKLIDSELKLLYKEPPTTPDVEKGYDKYVPILVRLVQSAVNGQWEGDTSVSKLLKQMELPVKVTNNEVKVVDNDYTKKVLVFVVGGVTSTEVQLIRQMGKVIFNDAYEFHVGSTCITHGVKLIKSVCSVIKSKL